MKNHQAIYTCFLAILTLLISGCATKGFGNNGEKFFHEDSWGKARARLTTQLDRAIKRKEKKEYVESVILPRPLDEMETKRFLISGWKFGKPKSKGIDLWFYQAANSKLDQYKLAIVYTKNQIIVNYRIKKSSNPREENSITTYPFFKMITYKYHIDNLRMIMNDAAKGAVDRFYEKGEEKLNNLNTDKLDRVKETIKDYKEE